MTIIHFPYLAREETRQMIERLVEQGRLGKHWLERPSLDEHAHEDYEQLKPRILARDNYTCQYCGATGIELACDHIIPRSKGGLTHPNNLVAVCNGCNSSKGSKTLEEWLSKQPNPAQRLSRKEAESLAAQLTHHFEQQRASSRTYVFLLAVLAVNKRQSSIVSTLSTEELAKAMKCKKQQVSQYRDYALKFHLLTFTPDLLNPGTGWYGINANRDEWLPWPEYGGARAGAGRPLGTYAFTPYKPRKQVVRKRWWEK